MHTLGIDIGTSKLALLVLNTKGQILFQTNNAHAAYTSNSHGRFEQSPSIIVTALQRALQEVPADLRTSIGAIGITGQMHGVLCWEENLEDCSQLITWEDKRCSQDGFLEKIAKIHPACQQLKDGFGMSTLAWWQAHMPEDFKRFTSCGTIMDYIAALLSDGEYSGRIDTGNAASFGLFDKKSLDWQRDAIRALGIPERLIPTVYPMGALYGPIGKKAALRFGLSPEALLIAPMGDNQASLVATIENPETDIALTLGTGGQISVIVDAFREDLNSGKTFELRPWLPGKYAAVAASLLGGKTLALLPETLGTWCEILDLQGFDRERIYRQLDELGVRALPGDLVANTSFAGERHDGYRRGSFTNISVENFTPGEVFAALALGTLRNLRDMLPHELLAGKTRVVGSGNGIRRLKTVQKAYKRPLSRCFNCHL